MGVITFTDSITSPVAASRLFKVSVLEAPNHIPKAAPQFVKSIDLIQGNGGPGSIAQLNFAHGAPVKYVKHSIDIVDKESLTYAQTVIEGGELSDKIESITHEIKYESTPDGGCKANSTAKYHIKSGAQLTEEEVQPSKEAAHALFKAVEAYLLANPDA